MEKINFMFIHKLERLGLVVIKEQEAHRKVVAQKIKVAIKLSNV